MHRLHRVAEGLPGLPSGKVEKSRLVGRGCAPEPQKKDQARQGLWAGPGRGRSPSEPGGVPGRGDCRKPGQFQAVHVEKNHDPSQFPATEGRKKIRRERAFWPSPGKDEKGKGGEDRETTSQVRGPGRFRRGRATGGSRDSHRRQERLDGTCLKARAAERAGLPFWPHPAQCRPGKVPETHESTRLLQWTPESLLGRSSWREKPGCWEFSPGPSSSPFFQPPPRPRLLPPPGSAPEKQRSRALSFFPGTPREKARLLRQGFLVTSKQAPAASPKFFQGEPTGPTPSPAPPAEEDGLGPGPAPPRRR